MTGAPRRSPLTVSAVREVPHTPERVYAFVAHMDNHWHLSDRRLRLQGLNDERRGGRIVIAGPLGLRRTAHTTVTTEHEPHQFGGTAAVGHRTRAHADWRIEPTRHGARVVLESTIASVGTLDRLLLALGGRWWLRRGFARVLARLADTLDVSHPTPARTATTTPAVA
ncbi:MAG: SRPBCC family protein [Thermoleophilaceae bacterium]